MEMANSEQYYRYVIVLSQILIPAALIHDVQVYAAYLEERELSEFLLLMLAIFHFTRMDGRSSASPA